MQSEVVSKTYTSHRDKLKDTESRVLLKSPVYLAHMVKYRSLKGPYLHVNPSGDGVCVEGYSAFISIVRYPLQHCL